MKSTETIVKELQKPFNLDEIEWRMLTVNKETMKGIALAYVSNRAIQNRLDEVCGIFGWCNEFREWKTKDQICGISILNPETQKWVTKWDGASDTDIEATKGGLSGSMKRATAQWGIGRYLYKIPNQWVKVKQQGKKYVINETPKLPEWALPEIKPKEQINWDETEKDYTLPEFVVNCLASFEDLKIKKEELEIYLSKQAISFDSTDIKTLRTVYLQIRNKEKLKNDFFNLPQYKEDEKNTGAKRLEQKLLTPN